MFYAEARFGHASRSTSLLSCGDDPGRGSIFSDSRSDALHLNGRSCFLQSIAIHDQLAGELIEFPFDGVDAGDMAPLRNVSGLGGFESA